MLKPTGTGAAVRGARRLPLLLGLLLSLLLAAGCDRGRPGEGAEQRGIRVGSFDFTESRLLAELYATALERAGYPVVRLSGLGPREIVAPALEQGLVDVVPEYAGSALRFLADSRAAALPDARELPAALLEALAERRLTALALSPGEDQNGVVVSRQTALASSLRTVSDLADAAPRMSFGGPPECQERPLCLRGLRERYGLQFRAFVPFASRAATAEALLAGQLDVGMLETVDPYLADGRLVLLTDDRRLQPPENVVPVLRQVVVDRYGADLVRLLDRVTATLSTDAMIELNRAVVLDHAAPGAVAAAWVQRQGLAGS